MYLKPESHNTRDSGDSKRGIEKQEEQAQERIHLRYNYT